MTDDIDEFEKKDAATGSARSGARGLRPHVIGVTGTIASGKSAVGKILAERGIPVIDTDKVVHQLLQDDQTTKAAIVGEFGDSGDILDAQGAIDRKALGQIVFRDEFKRRKLEGILHPNVIKSCRARVEELHDASIVAILVPLLFEANLQKEYDEIWSVYTRPDILHERLAARDKMDKAEVERRIAAQLPQEEKARRAHHVIDNSGSLEDTRRQVEARLITSDYARNGC